MMSLMWNTKYLILDDAPDVADVAIKSYAASFVLAKYWFLIDIIKILVHCTAYRL